MNERSEGYADGLGDAYLLALTTLNQLRPHERTPALRKLVGDLGDAWQEALPPDRPRHLNETGGS